MRTIRNSSRLLGGVPSPGGCNWSQRVYLVPGGVPAQGVPGPMGGVPAWGVYLVQAVYLVLGGGGCTCPGGVPGPGGCACCGVYLVPGGCTWSSGVYLPGGVPGPRGRTCPGGVPGPRGCTWSRVGVYLPGGVPGPRGIYLVPGVGYLPRYSPPLWTEWQTGVKT